MPHYSVQSDADDNPQFRRDWGAGPALIRFRSEQSKPARPTGKTDKPTRRSTVATADPNLDVGAA